MIQKFEFPPNYDKIAKVFDIEGKPVVFTYGNTLYNPLKGGIPNHLWIHEETHTRQQNDNPDAWWDEYLTNPAFRLKQEVEAYHNQYVFFKKNCKDRNQVAKFLHKISSDLSSEIYGNLCSQSFAKQLIQTGTYDL